VVASSVSVITGMLNLMRNCPKEAAHLRKELLIAARHIFATDLRQSKFLYYIWYNFKYNPYCCEKVAQHDQHPANQAAAK